MGVHELWPILEPVRHHVPLQSLGGMTLAVDLSIWVCEAQSVKQMVGIVAKPHLRNVFFRISSLNLMGVKLVFVTEGEAPKVKADTMNKRNEMRYGASSKPAPARPGRSYFKSVLKECLRMLDCLGIPWVEAAGEAEAMCAYLNAKGYVDGCITNDGDVFLYGAQTVYRNFTMNVKDPHVDRYDMSSIKDKLGLDRESLVGLAILLGCDYIPKGLPGVGRHLAMEFVKSLKGESVLQRFYQWRKQFDDSTTNPKAAKKAAHCSVCCHPGSAKEHERKGCEFCTSERYCEPHGYDYSCPCPWHIAEQEKKDNPLDYRFKLKAKKREGFPYREVIQEFLVNKDKLVKVIKWVRPSLSSFQKFALEKMEWPRHYACEKLLVLLAYYDMHERKAGRVRDPQLQAVRILKTRVRNGIPCYEIEWVKPDDYVFPDDHPAEGPLLTIEEESLFKEAYPHIVELFLKDKQEAELLKLKCKKSKPKSKLPPNVDDVVFLLSGMSLTPELEKPSSTANFKTSGEPSMGPKYLERAHQSSDLIFSVDPSAPSEILMPPEKDFTIFSVGPSEILKPPEKDFSLPSPALYNEDDGEKLPAECYSPVQGKKDPTVSSPNISGLISELQLSSIDWEGTSFSNSPSLESRTTCNNVNDFNEKPTADEPGKTASNFNDHSKEIVGHSKENLRAKTEHPPSVPLDSHCSLHLQKLPLRERILLKNAAHSTVSHPQRFEERHLPLKPLAISHNNREPVKTNFISSVQVKENVPPQVHNNLLKLHGTEINQKKNDMVAKALERPTTKSFSFVKKSIVLPDRTLSDGSLSSKTAAPKTMLKKSVCRKVTLSSDEEEAGEESRNRCSIRNKYDVHKESRNSKTEVPLKAVPPDFLVTHPLPDRDDGLGVDENVFVSPKLKAVGTVFAKSSEEESDGEDSLVSDSPLPLSERLKLRLLQNC